MKNDIHQPAGDALAAQLKSAAEDSSPEFSELLHHRIMQQIKSAPAQSHVNPHFNWQRAISAAALVLIAISIWKFRPRETPAPPPPAKFVSLPTFPAVGDVLAESTAPLEHDLTAARLGLNRDAERLGQFVLDQLDVLPRGQKRHEGTEARRHEGT